MCRSIDEGSVFFVPCGSSITMMLSHVVRHAVPSSAPTTVASPTRAAILDKAQQEWRRVRLLQCALATRATAPIS